MIKVDRIFFWGCMLLSMGTVLMNVAILVSHRSQTIYRQNDNKNNNNNSNKHNNPASSIATDNRNPPCSQQPQQQQHRSPACDPASEKSIDEAKSNSLPFTFSRLQHYANTLPQDQERKLQFRRSRTLMGIMSADTMQDRSYRRRHRYLFSVWNDKRVCSLGQLQKMDPLERRRCQLVYTFIIGAGDVNAPTHIYPDTNSTNQLQQRQASTPLLLTNHMINGTYDNWDTDDITLLNIKENMNDGKSPTFFYFASTILEKYQLDYAMKFDGDSILHLHDWFLFAHNHLPPRPYSRGIVAGALRHKAYWQDSNKEAVHHNETRDDYDHPSPKEHFWIEEYDNVHLYLAGQCYLFSYDVCQHVAKESGRVQNNQQQPSNYLEGFEDHDVSSMAMFRDFTTNTSFQSPTTGITTTTNSKEPAIRIITIGKSQRFWEHPVKGQPRWDRIRVREESRMNGTIFEGKRFRPLYLDP